jgi:hypothetical protein
MGKNDRMTVLKNPEYVDAPEKIVATEAYIF